MNTKKERGKIDWMITLVPLAIVIALCVLFFFAPEQSNTVLSQIRFFFGDTFGTYYLVIGLGIFILSLYIAGSKYGNIVLGEQDEKPKYSFFAWGSMMFTCGLAADILFYSFSEWVLYATDPHLEEMGSIQDWAGVYPLFHWSFIPWGFYLVLAVAFGFMLHVRKRNRQKYLKMLETPAFLNQNYVEEKQAELIRFLYNIFDQPIEKAFRRNRFYWGERYERRQKIGEKFYWEFRKLIPVRDALHKIVKR